jgi:glycosyltransferase involved in cell wall biosynthesis
MNPTLSIIIPIYNEENIAATSLPLIFDLPLDKEVIVVNDGSSDKTPLILADLKARYNFQLINQPLNKGKGSAIRHGLQEITGKYFTICDADSEYNPDDIIQMLAAIKQKGDKAVLYGSRFLNKSGRSFHCLVNKFLTGLTNTLFGSRLTDMETCFKMIPSAALQKIKLSGERFEIEPIITAQLLKNGYTIYEIPIDYRRRGYKEGKKISPRDGLIAVFTLFKERF